MYVKTLLNSFCFIGKSHNSKRPKSGQHYHHYYPTPSQLRPVGGGGVSVDVGTDVDVGVDGDVGVSGSFIPHRHVYALPPLPPTANASSSSSSAAGITICGGGEFEFHRPLQANTRRPHCSNGGDLYSTVNTKSSFCEDDDYFMSTKDGRAFTSIPVSEL